MERTQRGAGSPGGGEQEQCGEDWLRVAAPGGVGTRRRRGRGMGTRHEARARTATSSGARTTRPTATRGDVVVEGGRVVNFGGAGEKARGRGGEELE